MSRYYATLRLLEHGAMRLAEFAEVTGWPYKSCCHLLQSMAASGAVRRIHMGVYALPEKQSNEGRSHE